MHNRAVASVTLVLGLLLWVGSGHGQEYNVGIARPPATAGGSSNTVTIFDDFSTDTDAHYDSMLVTCTVASGEMGGSGSGLCKPLDTSGGTPPGTQPSSADQWGIVHQTAAGGLTATGVSLRTHSSGSPGSSEVAYAAYCTSGGTDFINLFNCTNQITCTSFDITAISCGGGFGADAVDDVIGFAVAGTGVNTEFCVWFWETGAAGPTIDGSTVPDDWGNASECISSDGTAAETTMTAFFASASATSTWDAAPDSTNAYSDTNDNCAIMLKNGGTFEIEDFVCGDL